MSFYDEHLRDPLYQLHLAQQSLLKAIRAANPQPREFVDEAGPVSLVLAAQIVMETSVQRDELANRLRMAAELLEEHNARTAEQREAA